MPGWVKFDKKWEINSREDYDQAMHELDENEFVAEMSDDFYYWQREKAEVEKQRFDVRRQAIEKGIIKEERL